MGIIGTDRDWEQLLYYEILQEGETREGLTFVTDGCKWGAMDWNRHPIIPIKYDFVEEDEFEYGRFQIVCGNNPFSDNCRIDIYNCTGVLKQGCLKEYHNDNVPFPLLMKMELPQPSSNKFFICLANSYKRGGRCIAGVEIVFNKDLSFSIVRNEDGSPHWIRPVARTMYGEIPNFVAEGIELLSVIKLTDIVPCPEQAHVENVYYSRMEQCEYSVSQEPSILNQLIDSKHQSIFHNRGRAVSAEMLMGINYSLMLIHPDKAGAYRDENREKSKNRMKFTYYGVEYDFPITDPAFLDEFKREPERYADIPNVYLAISLGLEFEGWHHKLVAGVIIPADSAKPNNSDGVSYMNQQKQLHHNAYAKWTNEDDEQLCKLVGESVSIQELCRIFGRNEGAIRSRISKLGLDIDNSTPHIFGQDNGHTSSHNNHPNWFEEYERKLVRLLDKKNDIEEQISEVRAKILQGMESHCLDKIQSEQFSVSYTPTKTVMQFDSRAFRTENEELYSSYCKPRVREASIVIKRNQKDNEI